MDLKEENAVGGDPASHWYYIAKGRAIRSLIGAFPAQSILDVGAGSGVFSRMLTDVGVAKSAVCVDPNYTDEWLENHHGGKIAYVRSADRTDASLVLMIDVIEHVDDDVALISEYARIATPGTRFVISVPAFNFLWSSHDKFLEHRRRYTRASLMQSVLRAGLQPLEARYFFGMLFSVVAASRLADRLLKREEPAAKSALKAAPSWLNRSLIALHDIERLALFPINRAVGVTAFCLAEKPAAVAQALKAA